MRTDFLSLDLAVCFIRLRPLLSRKVLIEFLSRWFGRVMASIGGWPVCEKHHPGPRYFEPNQLTSTQERERQAERCTEQEHKSTDHLPRIASRSKFDFFWAAQFLFERFWRAVSSSTLDYWTVWTNVLLSSCYLLNAFLSSMLMCKYCVHTACKLCLPRERKKRSSCFQPNFYERINLLCEWCQPELLHCSWLPLILVLPRNPAKKKPRQFQLDKK